MGRHRLSRLLIFVIFTVFLAVFALGSAITILLGPGIKFATPEETVQSYWDSFSKQNLERASLSFSDVRMINVPEVVQNMWPSGIQINGIEIKQKTVLDKHSVFLKYTVFLKRGQYVTGDLLSYDDWFGWRITGPTSEAPK